ncbi:hypothetical protein LP090_10860 [Moraxella bovis]|uniref:hypothetical protein n=1 Tax=Moraxella bovis TaxID=476 RepID=UPI002226D3F6|nr:hypothetical protein [Moraxella bovis]UZA42670.1 hypothetical protein LP090_10860 [Moraxella bovis]
MRAKHYPIRPKQAQGYLMVLSMPILYIVPTFVLTFFLKDNALSYWQNFIIATSIGLVFYFLVRAYFKPKMYGIALIIDDKGIRTNSNFLNKLPNSTPILLKDIDRIDYAENSIQELQGKLLSKGDPYLKNFNKTLIIHASKKERFGKISQKFMISHHMWEIDNFDELLTVFAKYGHTPTAIDNQTYIKDNMPQLQELGKRSGYLAYSSFFLFIIMGVLFYFDKFITLDFGNMSSIFMGVAVLVGIMGLYYVYHENKEWQGAVSLVLFVPITTVFIFSVMLFLSPFVGRSHLVDFDFKGGKWQTNFNQKPLEIECQENQTNINSDGKVNIIDTLGMIRISFDEINKVCHGGKFTKGD